MENSSVQAVDPDTSQHNKIQNHVGSGSITAQDRSCVVAPRFTGVNANNITMNVTLTNVPPDGRPACTNTMDIFGGNIQKCQAGLKDFLQNETKDLFQGTEEAGSFSPLDKIYTELYITEGSSGQVNREHEVIKLDCRKCTSEERKIHLNNIFEPLSMGETSPQRVLTEGIAGIGKTVAVKKFTHDWATGKGNQSFNFIFSFTFRDLNLIKDKRFSLIKLISKYYDEVKDLETSDYMNSRLLFIFDGLDESQLPLDFKNNEMCRSVTEETSVDVLLTNLIKGKLLNKSSVWITSRPAAASKIPPEFINRVTEVRGFNDKQKEEYFRKSISDQDVAQTILNHLQSKALRSLYIMCHIPVFCWILVTALQNFLTHTEKCELPKTVTEMYTHFLIIQTQRKQQDVNQDVIMKLAKLAFEQLEKGNIIFHKDDLKVCDIDLEKTSIYSGVCTKIIRKESGLHRRETYSFIHLTVQEFLAALYVLETFLNCGENLIYTQNINSEKDYIHLHETAVDKALASEHGQWDMFLRFLLGLSQDQSRMLLHQVFGFERRPVKSNQQTIKYIHSKIKRPSYSEKSINLFFCLNELGDQSLVEQVQKYQSSGDMSKASPSLFSALAFVLLVSGEDHDEFDLKKYSRSDEALGRLIPVFKLSTRFLLSDCNLTFRCCESISSVLRLSSSVLEELDLSRNNLEDSGMRRLSDGLKHPNCKLQRLKLSGCHFKEEGCASLTAALRTNPSHLKELDLSYNDLTDLGVKQLSDGLKDSHCKLDTLRLSSCKLSVRSCEALGSVLSSKTCSLKELDLSNNDLEDSGVNKLSTGLMSPYCSLESLSLSGCLVTGEGCAALASALRSNPSHLKLLDLSFNHPGDSGIKALSGLDGLKTRVL